MLIELLSTAVTRKRPPKALFRETDLFRIGSRWMKLSRRKLMVNGAHILGGFGAIESGLVSPQGFFGQQPSATLPGSHHAMKPSAGSSGPVRPWLQPDKLSRFVDRLPIPPILRPQAQVPSPADSSQRVGFLSIEMRTADVKVHRDFPTSRMWSYNGTVPGPTIEARKDQPLLIDWTNHLPDEHFLPIDHTLCGAGADLPKVRTAVHVHGAVVPPESDGYPEHWQTAGQTYRALYPLRQDGATLWYHDHAMGIERLNQYAGLFGFFLIRDEHEATLNLPADDYEIPIAFCDRLFFADGQLHYPDSGDPSAPWVPEVYGDVILANGSLFPFLEVEPRTYRFRIVNASNTRFLTFSLSNGIQFTQIGSDQGLLPAAAVRRELSLSCAERADVLIDFSSLAGQRFTLINQSQAVMEFRVAARAVAVQTASTAISRVGSFMVPDTLRTVERIPETAAVRTRTFTLNEYMHPQTHVMLMLLDGKYWHDPVSESPVLDSVEIWNFVNTTQDLHPIHLHLVRFQLLDRRAFDVDDYLSYGKFQFLGAPALPEPEEAGWKDTIQVHPETVTRIIIPFKGFAGRYVWHCHLLEHAANEMMRPFEVIGLGSLKS